jgi:hypothetical protein
VRTIETFMAGLLALGSADPLNTQVEQRWLALAVISPTSVNMAFQGLTSF